MLKKDSMKFATFITIFTLVMITLMTNVIATSNIGPNLVSMTSNSIVINVVFNKSGAAGNKLEIINKTTKKAYSFEGIKQNNVLNGTYVAKGLDANTEYQIRLTYLLNDKSTYKDIIVKTENKCTFKKISPKDAYEIMQKNTGCKILDVRPVGQYNQQRISGAISMPYANMNTRALKELTNKNALILIYCSTGLTSDKAAKLLVSLGYTNVYDFGSISRWSYGTVK